MKTQYGTGVVLVAISAVVWSSAGIFTRGVTADAWSVIFWRGLAAAIFTILYLILHGTFRSEWRAMTWPAMLATFLMASGTAAFIPAFKLSSVANVALIWAGAPFVTALLSWVVLRESPSRRVIFASLATLAGVAIVAWGSLQTGHVIGDLLALWMTLMMSGAYIVYQRWPHTPTVLPAALSSVVLLPLGLLFSHPLNVVPQEQWILIAFGAVFALASVFVLEGARRIPSAEVALLGALETPLAPILAYMILAEIPALTTLVGGAIILMAVIWAQWRGLRVAQV